MSLPSRERGLKHIDRRPDLCQRIRSLPSRERGLKHAGVRLPAEPLSVAPFAGAWIETLTADGFIQDNDGSLPSRERGLKPDTPRLGSLIRMVAPFAGAWIETRIWHLPLRFAVVAPFAGAWIETFLRFLTH